MSMENLDRAMSSLTRLKKLWAAMWDFGFMLYGK